LAERAVAHNENLKVLMMTGFPSDQPPPSVLRAREVRTLRKPFSIAKMCELVSEMLARP
jgi:DNA-binding NtrC family response regulator